ncbi:MAG: UDP-2,3-diacylglucosamine diphosphatase [Bacteroidia bacterium]|nr:UDP-2,3-diacylglucosamine diphosphatase [Bacteroidia bacterium]
MEGKKIFFASDFHLGVPDSSTSLIRERSICRWIEAISKDALAIYLLGDLFDFWFEHRYTCPKGHTRFLGKLASVTDNGIPVHVFTGNHDMWMFDYLTKEAGLIIHRKPLVFEAFGKKIMVGHGDGLGPGDPGYKIIKKIFANPLCIWLFARMHPNISFRIARFFSKKSRLAQGNEEVFQGENKEWLISFCKEYLKKETIDFFIFGHRHLVIDYPINNARYLNLGHWFGTEGTYAELCNDGKLYVKKWPIK